MYADEHFSRAKNLAISENHPTFVIMIKKKSRQCLLWIAALAVGVIIGLLNVSGVNALMNFIAALFTRLFQLLAVPTIALAVTVTMASFGTRKNTGRVFRLAVTFTLLTTVAAAATALLLFLLIAPDNMPAGMADRGMDDMPSELSGMTYYDHILQVIPNNIVRPLLDGNVLSILLLSFAVGIVLARLPRSDGKTTVIRLLQGMQEVLFALIHALILVLPAGIMAYAAQLAARFGTGVALGSLGRYTAVILLAGAAQIVIILPLFLLFNRINPLSAFFRMSPALLMAFFTKSSAATLPVTMDTAEQTAGVSKRVSRFVLPLCTTINMNGCAAFILVTSLFVLQNSGARLTMPVMLLWVVIAVVSAIGNAGVPMGCFFLTLSLMAGVDGGTAIMGLILPIYTIIDMVETAENVWSDSCVAMITDRLLYRKDGNTREISSDE